MQEGSDIMGKIAGAYIFPHPPIAIPEIGRGEEKSASRTIQAMKKAAQDIKSDRPDTIIITTPHGPVFQDYIYISTSTNLAGDMGRFGRSDVNLEFSINTELVGKIIDYSNAAGIPCGGLENKELRRYGFSQNLDHGAFVPLYFVSKEISSFKLVHISISGLPFNDLYRFGRCIAKAVEDSQGNVVFLASGDLSHRLSHDAPYGYNKHGREFDELLVNSVETLDIERLLELDEDFCEQAGECGLRSFIMMFGALDGHQLKSEVYSYEGPFGVGYAIARIQVGEEKAESSILERVEDRKKQRLEELRENEDAYVALARHSLETYVRNKKIIKVPGDLPAEMLESRAGVFVSIKKNGQLRGCIGTIAPVRKNIAEEIIYNAISSGTEDPRFYPVQEDELGELVYSVDVLEKPEPINSLDELDVKRYGVIVRSGRRSGLLLPNLEGVDTPEEQVSIALKKAGIAPDENYKMERFEVVRHK